MYTIESYIILYRLPIEVSSGEEVVVEEVGMGKRKEVVVRCALKACRVLDSHGMLRKASQGAVHCGPGIFCILTSTFNISMDIRTCTYVCT